MTAAGDDHPPRPLDGTSGSTDESTTTDAASDVVAWDPDGTDLARSVMSRARATRSEASQTTGSPDRRGSRGRSARRGGGRIGAGWSSARDDDRDPQSLERTFERLVSERGWGTDLAVHAVIARWPELVGPEMAAHVRPERYADAELTVRADSTAWATQVRLLASHLVRRLNHEIGDGAVAKVIVLGPVAPGWAKGARRVRGRGPRDTYG